MLRGLDAENHACRQFPAPPEKNLVSKLPNPVQKHHPGVLRHSIAGLTISVFSIPIHRAFTGDANVGSVLAEDAMLESKTIWANAKKPIATSRDCLPNTWSSGFQSNRCPRGQARLPSVVGTSNDASRIKTRLRAGRLSRLNMLRPQAAYDLVARQLSVPGIDARKTFGEIRVHRLSSSRRDIGAGVELVA